VSNLSKDEAGDQREEGESSIFDELLDEVLTSFLSFFLASFLTEEGSRPMASGLGLPTAP
jgi:hypothetical protein